MLDLARIYKYDTILKEDNNREYEKHAKSEFN